MLLPIVVGGGPLHPLGQVTQASIDSGLSLGSLGLLVQKEGLHPRVPHMSHEVDVVGVLFGQAGGALEHAVVEALRHDDVVGL